MPSPTFTPSSTPGGERSGAARGEPTGLPPKTNLTHRSPEFDAAFAGVSRHLSEVLECAGVGDLTDAEIISGLQGVEALQRKITALQLTLATVAEDRTRTRAPANALASRYGCRNAVELIQRTTLVSARHARQRIRLGGLVTRQNGYSNGLFPARYEHVSDALARGFLGIEAVSAITGMLDAVHRHDSINEHITIAERELVHAAAGAAIDDSTAESGISHPDSAALAVAMHADQTRAQCQVWQQFLDPDGTVPNDDAAFLKREFRFGRARNGLVPVTGALAPETAALMARIFDSINSPRTSTNASALDRTADTEGTTGSEGTSDTEGASLLDARTPNQKRHDALAVMLETIARHPETPLLGGAPVTVLIQTTETSFASQQSDAAPQGIAWIKDHEGATTPISMRIARRAACSGAVQRVVQDSTGRITSLGIPERLFNAHQRRAITLRDGGCVIPGCTVPASWCEVHHVIEYARGGPTHTDNGVLLCWYHHRSIDTNGWHVRMHDGVPETRAPGWIDPDRPWRLHKPPDAIFRRPLLREAA